MLRNTLLPPIQTPARDPVSNGRYSGLFFDLRAGTYRLQGRRSAYSDIFDLTRPGPTTILEDNGDLITVPTGRPALGPDGQQVVPFPYANILRSSEVMSDWHEVPEDVTLEEISWGDFNEWKIQSATVPASGYYLKGYFNRNLSSGGVWADTTFNVRLRRGSCRYAVFTVQSSAYNPNPGGQSDTGSRYINVCVDFEEKTVTKFTSGNNAGDFTLKDSWSGDVVLLRCRLDSYFGTGANGYYYSISPSAAPAENVNLSDPQGGTVFASMCSVNDHGGIDLPYIPTYTATAQTRPADDPLQLATKDGVPPGYSGSRLAFFAEIIPQYDPESGLTQILLSSQYALTEYLRLQISTTSSRTGDLYLLLRGPNGVQKALDGPDNLIVPGQRNKVAFHINDTGDMIVAGNGVAFSAQYDQLPRLAPFRFFPSNVFGHIGKGWFDTDRIYTANDLAELTTL